MTEREIWADGLNLRLRFAAVFQGGGIRALFFPGHISGLLEKGVQRIDAYAGASGGALVAVALWAGLQPEDLLFELKGWSHRFGLVFSILSPFDVIQIIFSVVLFCVVEFANKSTAIFWYLMKFQNRTGRSAPYLPIFYGCKGKRFEYFINQILLAGLRRKGIHTDLLNQVLSKDARYEYITFQELYQVIGFARWVNSIQTRDSEDFLMLQEFFPRIAEEEIIFNHETEISNNILNKIYGRPTAYNLYFAPLFVSVFLVDSATPLVISSIDDRFLDLSISAVIRASAGHPFVFQPRKLYIADIEVSCTDGGLAQNLPTKSIFSDLPKQLLEIESRKHPYIREEELYHISRSPLVILGFSCHPHIEKTSYFKVLSDTLGGGARTFLEFQMSEFAPYIRHVKHRTSAAEPHYLDFFATSKKYIQKCYEEGVKVVSNLKTFSPEASLAKQSTLISEVMKEMRQIVLNCLGDDVSYVRSHLFIEGGRAAGSFARKHFAFESKSDHQFDDVKRDIAHPYAGLVGSTLITRCPVVCRIDKLQELRKSSSEREILGLRWKDIDYIPNDLNFCVTIPIFDYRQIKYRAGRQSIILDTFFEDCVASVDFGISGPIIGVISLDASFKQPPELPDILDIIVRDYTIQNLERLSLRIGDAFSNAIRDTTTETTYV